MLFVLALGWLDRSDASTIELGSPTRMLVVNGDGPVRVTTGSTAAVTHRDSWMVSRPVVATAVRGTEVVVRVACETRTPCRSSVDVVAPPSIELVIVSGGVVSIDRFDGQLTVLAEDGDVALGPVTGSARVLASGDITGTALRVERFDASTLGSGVTVSFDSEPTSVFVTGGSGPVEVVLPELNQDTPEAEVAVDSTGEVAVVRSQPGGSPLDLDE